MKNETNKIEIEINQETLERLGNAFGWCNEVNGKPNRKKSIEFIAQYISNSLCNRFSGFKKSLEETGIKFDEKVSVDNIQVSIIDSIEVLEEETEEEEKITEEVVEKEITPPTTLTAVTE